MSTHAMREHVTGEEMEDFRRGRLVDPARRSVAQHFAECAQCAARAAGNRSIAAAASALHDDLGACEHPDVDELFDYAGRALRGARASAVADHLRGCPRCREDVADAMRERERARAKPRRAWLAAAAMVAIAVLGAAWWLGRNDHPSPLPRVARAPIAQHVPLIVAEARRSGSIAMPAALRDLGGTPEALRGAAPAAENLDMRPAGVVVTSDRPEFSWRVESGRRYVVTVMCNEAIAAVSPSTGGGQWTPSTPLPRGARCVWQLERLPQHTILPQPPAPEPAFRILDAASLASIDSAGGDDFTAGVLYANAGAQKEALDHLRRWVDAHPHDDAARSVIESVRRW